MYYHNSPTPAQIKQLKAMRANEMRTHLQAMKRVSEKYEPTITKLQKLRNQELFVENEFSTGRLTPIQLNQAHATISKNRAKAARMVAKLTDTQQ